MTGVENKVNHWAFEVKVVNDVLFPFFLQECNFLIIKVCTYCIIQYICFILTMVIITIILLLIALLLGYYY